MRLLFDQNLKFKLCAPLEDLFPGSSQARLLGLDRADDRTLWNHVKVVWLRGGNRPTAAIEATLRLNHVLLLEFASENGAACLEIY